MNPKQAILSPRQAAEAKYAAARSNLLIALCFTVVNMVLYILGANTYLVFSITVPFYGAAFAIEGPYILDLVICGGIAAVCLALYFLCWLFSKKHPAWMTVALVLFCLDTVIMAGLFLLFEDVSGILDALGHVWVLYYLIVGVKNAALLKKLPPEEEAEASAPAAEAAPTPAEHKDPWER